MPNKRLQTLEAAISLALPLLILYLVWFPSWYLVLGAGAILLLGLLAIPPVPWLLQQWMKVLHLLGIVNTKIILGLIFFGVLTPLAWVYRLFHKPKPKKDSNFVDRNHTFDAADFDHTF